MAEVMIKDALGGKPGVGQQTTVKGWVRTRRDSKAGFSFVQINDGSCFDSIQAVCPNSLPNYAGEIAKLTAGCAVIITGQLAQSQGKGQAYEIQASEVKVRVKNLSAADVATAQLLYTLPPGRVGTP